MFLSYKWCLVQLLFLSSFSVPGSLKKIHVSNHDCPCEDIEECDRVHKVEHIKQHNKEVIVMSVNYEEPRRTWKSWHWPAITSVISSGRPDSTLMCITHREGRRYGFSGKLVPSMVAGVENENPTLTSWISNITDLAKKNFVDIFLLNLVEVLTTDLNNTMMEKVLNTTEIVRTNLHSKVDHNITVVCLVPWQPPCYKNKCDFASRLNSLCEFFMLSADSFLPTKGEKCIARATIPFPQLHLGFDEYMINKLPAHKFILSIPWHGYAYHCKQFIPSKGKSDYDQCIIQAKDGVCDHEHCRVKVDMNQLVTTYDEHFSDDEKHVWHRRYEAPYFMTKNKTSNETMQVWYEDYSSLHGKYIFIRQNKLGGVALWSGNDLHFASKSWFKGFSNAMWSWVLHGMYLQKDTKHPSEESLLALPKKMAGIGIGCVFIGGFLGFIFGWGVFTRTYRKNRRLPFEKDMEYIEEDQNL